MNSKLESRLLNYFLLIAFAAILIGIEFYFEMDAEHGQNICSDPARQQADLSIINPLDSLRNKILIMFMVLSIVVAIVLTMFIRNITAPLSKMALVARHINEGDLSQTVSIDNHDEIGEVGIAINELASNLQEVATFTSATANETLESIKHLQGLVVDNPEIAKTIDHIRNNLLSMSSFVNSFKLLDTKLSNA
jgi:methyl-accepting chemotaxis protein